MIGLVIASPAAAVQTQTLPGWVCTHPDALFVSGFESADAPLPHDPSGGTVATATGNLVRQVHVAGLGTGTQSYYLFVPSDYTPRHAWPLLLALDGVAPYADAASYAMTVRDTWSAVAQSGEFIVAAPVGHAIIYNTGVPYAVSWLVPPSGLATDYDQFAAIRADLEGAYNIERTRIYGWGFSAGGHVMHDLAINTYSSAFNAATMAAYAVSAGNLAGLACAGLSDTQCNQLLAALPRRIPLDIHIGNADPGYPQASADRDRFLAQGWIYGSNLRFTVFVGGHTYSATDLQQIWTHLCPNAVTP